MATYNAGAIEATLDLDTDPFQRGLSEARAEGRRFGEERFTATLELDSEEARAEARVAKTEFERLAQTYTARIKLDGAAQAATEAKALRTELDAITGDNSGGRSGTVSAIRKTEGGIKSLIPALAILATGLVPLSAAAVPILGLANNLTLAAGAGGAAVLAFQGVMPALKAANAAAIAPTAANLTKLHQTMAGLHPQARAFIADLRDMGPAARDLRNAAAGEFFPGLRRGLDQVDLGDYRGLIKELAGTAGVQLEKTLGALDDPRWRRFFRFVKGEARPGVDALGTSVGNLAGFFASLWMAFDPLNDDFSGWLVQSTGDLRAWADALPDDPGFQKFIAYVREQGPHAADALSAVGGAILDIVKASAPLGGAVLDTLTVVGHLVSDIADSPFGPTIIEGLSAIYLLNKALTVTETLMTRSGLAAVPAKGKGAAAAKGKGAAAAAAGVRGTGAFGFLAPVPGKVSASWRGLTADTKTYTRAVMDAGFKMGATTEAAERMGSRLRTVGKGAAGIAAVAAVSSGLTDKLGLTQTATMALAGAMIGGVPGAVAGGLVGALMDASSSGAQLEEQQRQLGATLRAGTGDFTGAQAAMMGSIKTANDYSDSLSLLGKAWQGWDSILTGSNATDKVAAQREADARYFNNLSSAGAVVGMSMDKDMFPPGTIPSMQQLDQVARSAAPAMQALGYSWDELAKMDPTQLVKASKAIADWTKHADSAAGRTDAFAGSVAALGNDALSTADSASAMSAALEALLGPQLNLEASTDAWHASLKALETDLKAGAGFKGYGENAVKNREITRQYATDSMTRLKDLANVSTTTEKDMANAVAATRREFIRSGMAAGFSRKEIVARAKELGLTPKMVRTVFEAVGITKADLEARQLKNAYNDLPKDVRAKVAADGIPTTKAQVNDLVKRYELTEKERRALLTLRDLASSQLINAARLLDQLNGKTAVTYVKTVHYSDSTGVDFVSGGARHAAGGPVYGPGTGTSDDVPAWLSNGEHVWTAREVANAGGHAAVEAIREQFRYAAGGMVALKDRGRVGLPARGALTDHSVDRLIRAIRESRSVSVPVSSREDVELAIRALEDELSRKGDR